MLLHAICQTDVSRVLGTTYNENFNPVSLGYGGLVNEGLRNLGYDNPSIAGRIWVRDNYAGDSDFGWDTGALKLRRNVSYEGSLFVNLRFFGGASAGSNAATLLTFGMLTFGFSGRRLVVGSKEVADFDVYTPSVSNPINVNAEFEFQPGSVTLYLDNVEVYRQELPADLRPTFVELQGSAHIGFRHLIIYDSSGDELNERQGRMRLRSVSPSLQTTTDMQVVSGSSSNGFPYFLSVIPQNFEGISSISGNSLANTGGYALGNKKDQHVTTEFQMPDAGLMVYKGALLNTVARKEEEGNPSLGVVLHGDNKSNVKSIGTGKWSHKSYAVTIKDLKVSVSLDVAKRLTGNLFVPTENGIDVYTGDAEVVAVEEKSFFNSPMNSSNTYLAAPDYRYYAYTPMMAKSPTAQQSFVDASTIKADDSNMPPA